MTEGRSLDVIEIQTGIPLGGQMTIPYLTQGNILLSLMMVRSEK